MSEGDQVTLENTLFVSDDNLIKEVLLIVFVGTHNKIISLFSLFALVVSVQKAKSELSLSYLISILKVEPIGIWIVELSGIFAFRVKDQPSWYFKLYTLLNCKVETKGIPLLTVLVKKRWSFEINSSFNVINFNSDEVSLVHVNILLAAFVMEQLPNLFCPSKNISITLAPA